MTRTRLSKREKLSHYQRNDAAHFYRASFQRPRLGFIILTVSAFILLIWLTNYTTPWNARLLALTLIAGIWCTLCLRATSRFSAIAWLHWQDRLLPQDRSGTYQKHSHRIDPYNSQLLYLGISVLLITGSLIADFWQTPFVPLPFWIWGLLLIQFLLAPYLMNIFCTRFNEAFLRNNTAYRKQHADLEENSTPRSPQETKRSNAPSDRLLVLTRLGFPYRTIKQLHQAQKHFELSDQDILDHVIHTYYVIQIARTKDAHPRNHLAHVAHAIRTLLRLSNPELYTSDHDMYLALEQAWEPRQWLLAPYGRKILDDQTSMGLVIGAVIIHAAQRHPIHWNLKILTHPIQHAIPHHAQQTEAITSNQ
jgi:hypothetical protein